MSGIKTESKGKNLIIDVDIVIDSYNSKHPELKPLTRKILAEKIECNPQVFTDWKAGKTPTLVFRLFSLMEIGKMKLNDFIITKS